LTTAAWSVKLPTISGVFSGRVSIPAGGLTDQRQQHKATFDTEVMARVALYQTIYDPSQSEVADHLEPRPALLKELGLSRASTQQNLSYVLRLQR
jgi:hypothetical protein